MGVVFIGIEGGVIMFFEGFWVRVRLFSFEVVDFSVFGFLVFRWGTLMVRRRVRGRESVGSC